MEPTEALRSIETALRLAIHGVLGYSEWLAAPGVPPVERLKERQAEESRRRDGAVVSSNLLDYAETYHLTEIVKRNWERFQPVFGDKARTLAYFGVVEDVRNSVAHSRDLVPFERDLISGIAGHLRNQISLYRSSSDQSSIYYPLIESLKDNFGADGNSSGALGPPPPTIRLDVGSVLTFTGSAYNAKGTTVKWNMVVSPPAPISLINPPLTEVAQGDSVRFDYVITEANVSERFGMTISITTDSRYHRYGMVDDSRHFNYAVNPPYDE